MTCFAITRSASDLLFTLTPEFCCANVPNVARVNTVVVAPLGGVASAAPTTRARVLTPSTTRNIARLIVVVLSSSPWPTRPLVSSPTLPVSSFHKGAGLVGPATRYAIQRGHGNKHEVSSASPKRTIFIRHVAIP